MNWVDPYGLAKIKISDFKKLLKRSLKRSGRSRFKGLSNREIMASIGKEQKDRLRQCFGKGQKGALDRLNNPQRKGLTDDTLDKYEELARRQIERGKDTNNVQKLRREIIDKLRELP